MSRITDIAKMMKTWWNEDDDPFVHRALDEIIRIDQEQLPTIEPKTKVIAQVTFDEEKMREIVKEAVERFKEEYEIELKLGEWIWQSSMAGSFIERRYRCSNCQYEITTQREEPIYNFCPNCGARMKGVGNDS